VTICDDVIIGAGSVVVKDITEPGIYIGNPVVRMDRRPKYATKEDVLKLLSTYDKIK
jgi:acetyltransferase-like isoleucine patch superfamily enzyme